MERLNHVREIQEQAARAKWAEAEARARDAQDRVELLTDTLTRARAELDALLRSRSLANGDADSYEMPLEVMQGHLNAAVAERDVRRREADTEKEAWSECERDRRAAERLSEQARTRADEERTERELRIEEDLETARQEQRRRQERNQAS